VLLLWDEYYDSIPPPKIPITLGDEFWQTKDCECVLSQVSRPRIALLKEMVLLMNNEGGKVWVRGWLRQVNIVSFISIKAIEDIPLRGEGNEN